MNKQLNFIRQVLVETEFEIAMDSEQPWLTAAGLDTRELWEVFSAAQNKAIELLQKKFGSKGFSDSEREQIIKSLNLSGTWLDPAPWKD